MHAPGICYVLLKKHHLTNIHWRMQSHWATSEVLKKVTPAFPRFFALSPSRAILSFCCVFIYVFHLLNLPFSVRAYHHQFGTVCLSFPSSVLYSLQLNFLLHLKMNSSQITIENVLHFEAFYFLINGPYIFVYSSKKEKNLFSPVSHNEPSYNRHPLWFSGLISALLQ